MKMIILMDCGDYHRFLILTLHRVPGSPQRVPGLPPREPELLNQRANQAPNSPGTDEDDVEAPLSQLRRISRLHQRQQRNVIPREVKAIREGGWKRAFLDRSELFP
jgi:hypothetical protein